MNRILGYGKQEPKPTLTDVVSKNEASVEKLDIEIARLQSEKEEILRKILRTANPSLKAKYKKDASQRETRRKQKEKERDEIQERAWKMDGMARMQDNLRDSMAMYEVQKSANKAMKKQLKSIDIDKVEKVQEEMEDMMEMGNEIQESFARSYDVPEEVDESELDAELDALRDEGWGAEGVGESAAPGFLSESAPPQFIDEAPEQSKAAREAAA